MNAMTLSPMFGPIVGGIAAAAMLLLAVAEVVRHARGAAGDETVPSCVRRTLMCLLVAVMALGPSVVTSTTSRAVNATDVVVAVDVTGSMAVADATYGSDEKVTRLKAAAEAVDDLTGAYADASFAAIRFGASATLDVPLTPDAPAIRNWADTLSPEATSVSAGSSLDAPLDLLVTTLKDIRERHPDDAIVLYVITDGEQTSAKTRRTFSTLRGYLDDAFTVGVGSTQGGPIPNIEDGVSGAAASDSDQWVTDPSTGQPGVSKMDEANLKAMADEMSGSYQATSAADTLRTGRSAKASDKWKVSETVKRRTRATPVTWPFAAAMLALLAWETGSWIAASRRLL